LSIPDSREREGRIRLSSHSSYRRARIKIGGKLDGSEGRKRWTTLRRVGRSLPSLDEIVISENNYL